MESSNKKDLPSYKVNDFEEATSNEEYHRAPQALYKLSTDESNRLDKDEKKRKFHDQTIIAPLTIDDKDFTPLLETGRLEYLKDSLDGQI